jgi:hypothetical protein
MVRREENRKQKHAYAFLPISKIMGRREDINIKAS